MHLRITTKQVHDRLDRSVGRQDILQPRTYSRFLTAQLRARAPIEDWAQRHCPADLRPPAMAMLLRGDLAELDPQSNQGNDPATSETFVLPPGADPLGLAWAIAGSQMGNRTMLAQLKKAGSALPTRFLGDARMTAFWRSILPSLEGEGEPEQAAAATSAAEAVFARFEDAFASAGLPEADAA